MVVIAPSVTNRLSSAVTVSRLVPMVCASSWWVSPRRMMPSKPTPKLRVALLTYGCTAYSAEAGWVRVDADFTTDLDTVSQKLFALRTNGGDEYVGRVLKTALQLEWCKDPGAMKLLWVAGNEAATQDPIVDFATQSRAALARGIVVNSIYCGNPDDGLAPAWRDVSKLAEGAFAAIDKDHAVVIPTPFDAKLVELSGTFNATYVAFGKERAHWAQNQVAQDCNAAGMNPAAAATRCLTKGSALYLNGHWDLVDACSDATFRLEDVKKDDLQTILGLLPALQRPTISSLSDDQWVAVNTIIEEKTVRALIPKLKAANAQGIVEYPLNKIVL
mgnify:CR=1 FL=1